MNSRKRSKLLQQLVTNNLLKKVPNALLARARRLKVCGLALLPASLEFRLMA
jgi:hypothetical protein